MSYEAKKYHAYARECLQLAEKADRAEVREKLMELSRVWSQAALNEERHYRGDHLAPEIASALT
jgi:hypothetical protein